MAQTSKTYRERLLDPVDRVSEILFGLIMAITIVGSLSVATAGQSEVRTIMKAALGCNLAWGLVDAVMYLVRTLTERTRNRVLASRIVDADAPNARAFIASTLPAHIVAITGPDELEAMRRRLLELSMPTGASLRFDDYAAALGIFLLVVLATFPVVLPFWLTQDVSLALRASQSIAVAMLFAAGVVLGRHAGYRHPLRTGLAMSLLGASLIAAVKALGG
jgi:VIT1/CCC1 family predicted Fe2+/Mn2+ transporter